MYLAPDAEECEIASAAAAFLADAMPIARLHATTGPAAVADMNAAMREALGGMGWFALAVPESAGGSGLTSVEHALFFREVGRQCGPVDVLAQCLAANLLDDAALRQAVIAGETGTALLVMDGSGFRLLGSTDAQLGLLASPESAELFRLDQLPHDRCAALDPANSLRRVKSLPPPIARIDGNRIWHLGQLAVAAMQVGIAEAALDLIVEYAKVRETFGRKIGTWQAVRHPCADMAVRAEAARAQLWYAATAIKEGRADAGAHLDAAKYLANLAAHGNADTAIQLHGGIGVTDEHDCHLLLKHAMVLSRVFGSRRDLLGRLLHARLDD
jgi:alkylation response protein AidB-like acyl-CoA dehydrogenase